eukprot:TRINITY_DN11932_c0_g1_i5.p1 TRINITY_DN11932_c0_g1~~TRINITY_DN11932_c0_g1_i5.p1  ORF type:complete len:147 (+),score=25.29 TRINITY_DN11932_c0_g1_i5:153-593(+)
MCIRDRYMGYVEKANHCVSFLVAQINKLGSSIERVVKNKHRFHEDEVLESSIKKTNIEKILDDIAESEKFLSAEFSFENLQILISKYQQAIEYYSALGDPKFEIYLNKMQDLMKREDAMACLDSPKQVIESAHFNTSILFLSLIHI